MSTSNGNATASSNARGSKCGACDRCRGQKLRCLHKEQSPDSLQATCIRCFKAGATCSFSVQKRAGRPPGSSTSSSQQQRGIGTGKATKGSMTTRLTVNTNGGSGLMNGRADREPDRCQTEGQGNGPLSGENATDHDSERNTASTTPLHALSPSPVQDSSNIFDGSNLDYPTFSGFPTAALPWLDETLPSFYNNDAEEASGFEDFGSKYSWAFNQDQAHPTGVQIPIASPISNVGQSRGIGADAYGTPIPTYSTNAQLSAASDEAMDLDLSSTSEHMVPLKSPTGPIAQPFQARDREKERGWPFINPNIHTTAGSAPSKTMNGNYPTAKPDEKTLSINEDQHRRMQELSKLAMDLYAQLSANDSESRQPTSSATTAAAFQDELVGSVLKSSNTFLTLLISFSATTAPSSSPFPPATLTKSHSNSTCDSSESGPSPPTSASTTEYSDATVNESLQDSHHQIDAGSDEDGRQLAPATDMTTVLQLLTCYIRLIHLHSIMHARILEYIVAFSNPNTPSLPHTMLDTIPPVFPGMQVGGVSLDIFGTFQVKLLLQISMHVLGEIEGVLGLPEEFRIGKSRGGERKRGVLEASVSGGFVKCFMREEAWRGKRVECVKERLGDLRRVLRGAVDF